ncbi:MAG TPA: YciI family protein [Planctomycetota bacterium]|nr:YciI family protein [Planctomycetota bacterium]
MHFMLLCTMNEGEWSGLPESTRGEVMRDYGALLQDLAQSGHLKTGAKLQPTATAATIRGRNGRMKVTDGPFAEAKEQIGGFHLIECRDRDEAVSIAKRIPSIRVGAAVEVRPVEFMEPASAP